MIPIIHEFNLVLDLDGTLVHVAKNKPNHKNYSAIWIDNFHRKTQLQYMTIRPHLKEFIDSVKNHFNLYIFTRGTKEYAYTVIEELGLMSLVRDIFTRDNLIKHNDELCKDL